MLLTKTGFKSRNDTLVYLKTLMCQSFLIFSCSLDETIKINDSPLSLAVLLHLWLPGHQLLQLILIGNSSSLPPLQLGGQLNTFLFVDKACARTVVILEPELPLLLLLPWQEVVECSKLRSCENPLAALPHDTDRHQHQRERDSGCRVGLDEVEDGETDDLDEGEEVNPWQANILEVDVDVVLDDASSTTGAASPGAAFISVPLIRE